jgi:hypothetical protein
MSSMNCNSLGLHSFQNKDGLVTIAGFGSLLSEKSARSTFPNLQNFRQGKVSSSRIVSQLWRTAQSRLVERLPFEETLGLKPLV